MLADSLKEMPVVAALCGAEPDAVLEGKNEHGELTLTVDAARIVAVCAMLKRDFGHTRLASVTAVDWYPMEPRFEVVYHLHSIERNERLRLKARVSGEDAAIDSVTPVWKGANWYEREVFDLFGITFRNHPGLTRIMMPEGWEGHPLRKDYPVHGHKYDYPNE